jgi:hypothetical protein
MSCTNQQCLVVFVTSYKKEYWATLLQSRFARTGQLVSISCKQSRPSTRRTGGRLLARPSGTPLCLERKSFLIDTRQDNHFENRKLFPKSTGTVLAVLIDATK